jgi:hypothetical protein
LFRKIILKTNDVKKQLSGEAAFCFAAPVYGADEDKSLIFENLALKKYETHP